MSRDRIAPVVVLLAVSVVRSAPPPPKPAAPTAAAAAPEERARVWLGIFFGNAVDGGVQLLEVVPDGPAAKAGLRAGDLLIRANGKDVAATSDLGRELDRRAPGDPLTLTVLRDGKPREARVVLGVPPPPILRYPDVPPPAPPLVPEAGASAAELLGIDVDVVPDELRRHLGGKDGQGLLVTRVRPGSPSAGPLKAGDLLLSVAGHAVADPDDLERALAGGSDGSVSVEVARDKKTVSTAIPVAIAGPAEREREARVRALDAAIRRLEMQLDALRRERAALKKSQ